MVMLLPVLRASLLVCVVALAGGCDGAESKPGDATPPPALVAGDGSPAAPGKVTTRPIREDTQVEVIEDERRDAGVIENEPPRRSSDRERGGRARAEGDGGERDGGDSRDEVQGDPEDPLPEIDADEPEEPSVRAPARRDRTEERAQRETKPVRDENNIDEHEAKPSLAVIPFRVAASAARTLEDGAGGDLATLVLSNIDASDYRVFERQQLEAILREKRFAGKGDLVDDREAIRAGRLAGIRFLVVGEVLFLGGEFTLAARVVDCLSGEIRDRGEVSFAAMRDVRGRLPELINKLGLQAPALAAAPREGVPRRGDGAGDRARREERGRQLARVGNDLFDISADGGSFGLNLRTLDGSDGYVRGDEIKFELTPDRDCYINMLTVDSSGAVTKLLPNRLVGADMFIRAGQSVVFPREGDPFRFTVTNPPWGRNRVRAIATLRPLRLAALAPQGKGALEQLGAARGERMKQAARQFTKSIGVEPKPGHEEDPDAPADVQDPEAPPEVMRPGQWTLADLEILTAPSRAELDEMKRALGWDERGEDPAKPPVEQMPEPQEPEQPKPQPPRPETPKPEPIQPRPTKPEPVRPAPPQPQPVKPQPDKPEPVKPPPVTPEPTKPQPRGVEGDANDAVLQAWLDLNNGVFPMAVDDGFKGMSHQLAFGDDGLPVSGEIVVIYKPGRAPQTKELTPDPIARRLGLQVRRVAPRGTKSVGGQEIDQELRKLRADPDVEAAFPNMPIQAFAYESDAIPGRFSRVQWGMRNTFRPGIDVNWPADRAGTIKPVPLAVIDQGLDLDDRRLRPLLMVNTKETPGNGQDDDGNGVADDYFGFNPFLGNDDISWSGSGGVKTPMNHGSFCSSIIGARQVGHGDDLVGLAPQAEIFVANALSTTGQGSLRELITAIEYATLRGARVINLSLGLTYDGKKTDQGTRPGKEQFDAVKKGLDKLWPRWSNVLFVVAAGNDANNNDAFPAFPASLGYDNIIAVAAIDPEGQLARAAASFPPRTPATWRAFSNYGVRSVHIAAPGTLIVGIPGTDRVAALDGTSFATPMVSAAASLVWGQHPDWTPAKVKRAILESVTPVHSVRDKVMSQGVLNVSAALQWTP